MRKLVRISDNAPFHRGEVGIFDSMAGPNMDVARIITERGSSSMSIICVNPEHMEEIRVHPSLLIKDEINTSPLSMKF